MYVLVVITLKAMLWLLRTCILQKSIQNHAVHTILCTRLPERGEGDKNLLLYRGRERVQHWYWDLPILVLSLCMKLSLKVTLNKLCISSRPTCNFAKLKHIDKTLQCILLVNIIFYDAIIRSVGTVGRGEAWVCLPPTFQSIQKQK